MKEHNITASILAQLEQTTVQNTVIDQNNASTPAAQHVAEAEQTDQQPDTRRPRMCMISSVQKNEVPVPLTPELLRQTMNSNRTVAL